MTIRKLFLGAALAAVAFLAVSLMTPRRADACGSGAMWTEIVIIGSAALATDVALTSYDIYKVAKDERPSKVYGFFEVLVAAPQLYLGLVLAGEDSGGAEWMIWSYTGWMTLLTAHGLYALVMPEERPLPAPAVSIDVGKDRKLTLMPTLVSDGKEVGGGLGAVMQW